jgi:hypothetical protein
MIFPEFINYLQISPGSGSCFFLILLKCSKYTHKGASDKCVFLLKAPSVHSTPPSLSILHQENTTQKLCSLVTVVIHTDICVFSFSVLVSVDPQKWGVVWYTSKLVIAHNPMLHSQHLNFVHVSLFLANQTRQRILLLGISQCLLCLVSSLASWHVDGTLSSLSCV